MSILYVWGLYGFPKIFILMADKIFSSDIFRLVEWTEEEGPQPSTSYITKEK